MKTKLSLLIILISHALVAQQNVNTANQKQVYYSFTNGAKSQIALSEWDIAIEPQGDYAIRINEASGTKVWVKTTDVRDNCIIALNCKGLQDYIPEPYDTTGMMAQSNDWVELHNSYDDWKIGALNQVKQTVSLDIVGYGWGAYRAVNTSPMHAIIGYRIFIVQLRNGDFKQFFVRKSLTAGFDYAYANLDGSDVHEVSIKREDYENKMFSYRSLIQHQTHNPEPIESEWDVLFTPYTPNKSNGDNSVEPGVLHNINRSTSEVTSTDNPCVVPGTYSDVIQTIGYDWYTSANEEVDAKRSFFVQNESVINFFKITGFENGNYAFVHGLYSIENLQSEATIGDENCVDCNDGSVAIIPFGGVCDYVITWDHGPQNFTLSNLSPGDYYYTLSDNSGASIRDTVTIAPFECTIKVMASDVQSNVCYGATEGSVELFIVNPKGDYTVKWNNGQEGNKIENLNAGSYAYTLTETTGCVLSDTIKITEPDSLHATLAIEDENCVGCNNGSVQVTAIGGVAPYTIVWSDDASISTFDRSNLEPKTYQAIITDANGCTTVAEIKIQKLGCSLIVGRTTLVNPSCYGLSDGSIFVDAVGNKGDVNFEWSNGENTNEIDNLSAGTYILIVSDTAKCTDSTAFTLTEPEKLHAEFTLTPASCEGCADAQLKALVNGGTSPYSYEWNTGDTKDLLENIADGEYTLTVTDKNGCTETFAYQYTNTVGIAENSQQGLLIYPNPSNDFVNITSIETTNISIVGIDGTMFYRQTLDKGMEKISTQNWPSGTYIIRSTTESRTVHQMMIVSH